LLIVLKKQAFQGIIFIILTALYFQCARVGVPTGGEKDTIPPIVKRYLPENFSRNFDEEKIEIDFDEFFQLVELDEKLVISPPLKEKPEIQQKGKGLIIDLKENKLRKNTTYIFNFSDAIVDNNEGNPIKDFEFVFSTGYVIDSFFVKGKVIRAFDLLPDEDVFVMLYENLNDSIPLKDTPSYIAKADDKGEFMVNYIKADTFRIIALKDMNLNYKFNPEDEPIAFLDSMLFIGLEENAGLKEVDTVVTENQIRKPQDIRLFLFTEEKKEQYLKSSERPESYKIMFLFNKPLTTELIVNPVDFSPANDWFLREDYLYGDTICYWIKDTTVSNTEILTVELIYPVIDSAGIFRAFSDTVTLRYTKPPVETRRRGRQETKKEERILKLITNVFSGSTMDLNSSITIESPTPLINIDTSKINIVKIEDTVEVKQEYRFYGDSVRIRKYWITLPWEGRSGYKVWIEPGAFTDIYENKNDTLILSFRSQEIEFYGNLNVSIQNVKTRVIVQLLDEKDKIIRKENIGIDKEIRFDYLHPGKYKMKAIIDENKNGKWDTGDYLKKIQPEKVLFYPKEINIRSNWDLELDWDIEISNSEFIDSI
jgi:hypothetical protein